MSQRQPSQSRKKPYLSPLVRSAAVTGRPPVMLACTGQVDCDALFNLGFTCCAATEEECQNC
jgi:hypothetical protein